MLTKLVAKSITIILPASLWYKAAFLLTKLYAKVSQAPYGSFVRDRFEHSFRLNHALKLEALLAKLPSDPKVHLVYPIPVQGEGEAFKFLKKDWPNGLLLCTVHTPLNLAGIRYILERGLTVDGIVARYPPEDGYYTITGTTVRIPAIRTDHKVLLTVKAILKRGGVVITSVDNLSDGSFSPNQFRLAEKLNAGIMLVLVELLSNGMIRNRLIEAPHFDGEDALDLKIKYMNEKILTILNYEYV